MNEPEKQHVLEGKCVIEADLDEFEVIRNALSYAADSEEDFVMRLKYRSALADLNYMHQTYRLAKERWVTGNAD